MSLVFLLLFQVFLIFLNAIFASAEIAVLSISEVKLQHMADEGNRKAKRLFRLTQEPAKFLATIQVAITLSGFLGSAFAADNFSEPLVDWAIRFLPLPRATLDTAAVILITLILSYFTLIFGELVPKRLAMQKSESIAMGISGLVSGISILFKPIVSFLSLSTNMVLRLCGVDPNQADDDVSEEEIRMLVDAGSEKGTIDHHEKEFIQKVFAFNDITAGDIATHRTDVTLLYLEDGEGAWEATIQQSRFTRYPICDGSPDNIRGILNAKDYFRLPERSRETILRDAVHPAYFVPESIKADVLFRNMKAAHESLAVVLDEYGGFVGLTSMNDLVEELVGELRDEDEDPADPEPTITKTGDNTWRLAGNVLLRDIEAATGIPLTEAHDTLTGLVFEALGAIPGEGVQNITVELGKLTVTVEAVEGHQISASTLTVKTETAPA